MRLTGSKNENKPEHTSLNVDASDITDLKPLVPSVCRMIHV